MNAAGAGKVFRKPQQKGIGIPRAKRDGFIRFASHFSGHSEQRDGVQFDKAA